MTTAIRKHLGDFLAILVLFVIAIGVGGYILEQQRLRFPLIEEKPKRIELELADAQAVIPGQGQTVRVAGVKVGDIATVEIDDGVAVVEVDIDKEYKNLITDEATALLRPKTGLKDMFIEVDPGHGEPLEDGDRIAVSNTSPDIDQDEFFAALDADTRDYLQPPDQRRRQGPRGPRGRLPRGAEAVRAAAPRHRAREHRDRRAAARTSRGSSTTTRSSSTSSATRTRSSRAS